MPAATGAGVFLAVFLLCIAFNRKSGKITPRSDENPAISSSTGLLHRVIGLPMVVSVALGTAVGLAVFA